MKNIILGLGLVLASFSTAQVSMDISNFSSIKIDSDSQIEIKYSPNSKIQYSGSMEELKNQMSMDGSRLILSNTNSSSKTRIYTNDLNSIEVSGNASISVNGFKGLNNLNVKTSENAKVNLGNTKIEVLSINQNGNSNVIATGANSTTIIKNGMMVSSL